MSLPARLADVGVQVLAGDSYGITYRLGKNTVSAEIVPIRHVSPGAATDVLHRLDRGASSRILIVCDDISDSAHGVLMKDGRVDLSVDSTGELVLSGTVYRAPTRPMRRPWVASSGWLRHQAARRVCILAVRHLPQREIAAATGVTQQAVSYMARQGQLPDTPMSEAARGRLLDRLLSNAVLNDRLIETYWYGLDSVTVQVRRAVELGEELTIRVLASGEVAADAMSPWRVPSSGLVYSEELIDLSVVELTQATANEATLTLRVPADPTVWTTALWWSQAGEESRSGIPTADPVVTLADLATASGVDDEAAERLKDWIVER